MVKLIKEKKINEIKEKRRIKNLLGFLGMDNVTKTFKG